ncbi:FAD-dependent monooxygenase [Streptomyces sp. B22F1]|uniref:FAD-dependent monooxygenase n=1 Tax=Streptomyces sp. B22F1 TaxID=3153566 RepID=UPI00325E4CC1
MSEPVVVVGAGPAGLMLASELAMREVPAVLVDVHPAQRAEAPAMAINAGTLEMLDQRGLAAGLREGTVTFPEVRFADLRLAFEKVQGPREPTHMVLQSRLEKVLIDRAVELGVDLRWATRLTGFEEAADGSGVTVTLASDAGEETLRCRYLVGCDGRDSVVREGAGIDYVGDDWVIVRGIVGDVAINREDVAREQYGLSYTENGDQFLGAPLSPDVMRVFSAEFSTDPPEFEDGPATLEQLGDAVERLTGKELKATEAHWLRHYSIVTRNAEQYRKGRVFLAGDAAHVHYPYNGQGIGTAIGDAVNLGWKIAAEVHGWAPEGLLDSYHDERHLAGRLACMNIQAQLALLYPRPLARYMREMMAEFLKFDEVNVFLAELVTNLGPAVPIAYDGVPKSNEEDRLLGRRLPQVRIKTAAGDMGVAETLQSGRGVLLDLSGDASAQEESGWADRVEVVRAQPVPELPRTLLLRPDGCVAWHDGDGWGQDELRIALRAWFGAPTA